MKLRYKILYMSFGAGLVVLGMVLNSLVSGDAEAQGGLKDGVFRSISCQNIAIVDGNGKWRGAFGLDGNDDAMLTIYGDDGKSTTAYLGENKNANGEMMFQLKSKSTTDKRRAVMMIDGNGGSLGCVNKIGNSVGAIGVAPDGGGIMGTTDKFGDVR